MSRLKQLLREAHQRSLWQALVVYLGVSFAILEAIALFIDFFALPRWLFSAAFLLLLLGLPVVIVTSLSAEEKYGDDVPAEAREAAAEEDRRLRLLTWRNSVATLGLVLLLVAAVAIGYMAMRTLGVGPPGTLLARELIAERDRIVVSDFKSETGDSLLALAVTTLFRTDLSQSDAVRVATPDYIHDVLERMGRDSVVDIEYATAREIALRQGLKAVTVGEVNAAGTGYLFTVRLLDAQDGEVLAAHHETAGAESEVTAAIERLSARLRERIGESLFSIRASPPLEQVTTPSLEALEKYSLAMRAWRAGERDQAGPLLEEALALDSTFAAAWRKLGTWHRGLGTPSKAVEAFRRAYELRDRLTEWERYWTTFQYYEYVERDDEKALQILQTMEEIDPDNIYVVFAIANYYYSLKDWASLERAHERIITLMSPDPPHPNVYRSLMFEQILLGKIDEARATLERVAEVYGDHPRVSQARMSFLASQFDYAGVEAEARRLLTTAEDDYFRRSALEALEAVARVSGRLTVAEDYLRQLSESWARQGLPQNALAWVRPYALIESELRQNPQGGRSRLEQALERFPLDAMPEADRPYLVLALGFAEASAPNQARQLLDHYYEVTDSSMRSEAIERSVMYEIHRAEGHYADALAEARWLAHAIPYEVTCYPYLARSFERLSAVDSALYYYEAFLTSPFPTRTAADGWSLARTYERLGQLYEERGDRAKAIDYYGRLVDLWKDADADLQPRVGAARRAMRALTADG
jgi:tetratricopeptide (TPR) repeat protein